jgi:hypothetical protein
MLAIPTLPGKTVYLKIEYLEQPWSAKVEAVDEHGLWIDGEVFAGINQQFSFAGSRGQNRPSLPFAAPVLFVPFCKIQWVAVQKG